MTHKVGDLVKYTSWDGGFKDQPATILNIFKNPYSNQTFCVLDFGYEWNSKFPSNDTYIAVPLRRISYFRNATKKD